MNGVAEPHQPALRNDNEAAPRPIQAALTRLDFHKFQTAPIPNSWVCGQEARQGRLQGGSLARRGTAALPGTDQG